MAKKKETRILPGEENEVREINQEKRIMWHKVSKEVLDRYNTIIRLDGMDEKNYRKNPVVLYGHNYGGMNPLPVIGKNIGFKREGKYLYAGTQFLDPEKDGLSGALSDLVNDLWALNQKGILGWSIGFEVKSMEEKKDKNDKTYGDIREWELYEYSNVILTGNQEAVNNAYEEGLISQRFVDEMPHDLGLERKSIGDPVNLEVGVIGDITDGLDLEQASIMADLEPVVPGNEDLGNKIELLIESVPGPLPEDDKEIKSLIKRIQSLINENEETRKAVRKVLADSITGERGRKEIQ